jgi:hypothetical protein
VKSTAGGEPAVSTKRSFSGRDMRVANRWDVVHRFFCISCLCCFSLIALLSHRPGRRLPLQARADGQDVESHQASFFQGCHLASHRIDSPKKRVLASSRSLEQLRPNRVEARPKIAADVQNACPCCRHRHPLINFDLPVQREEQPLIANRA